MDTLTTPNGAPPATGMRAKVDPVKQSVTLERVDKPPVYELAIACRDESVMRRERERLTREGYDVRVLEPPSVTLLFHVWLSVTIQVLAALVASSGAAVTAPQQGLIAAGMPVLTPEQLDAVRRNARRG